MDVPIAPTPPLGRAEIIAAANKASDALAAGRPFASAELAGRRFQIRLPFGCAGENGDTGPLRFTFEEETRTLRLTAAVQDWEDAPWMRTLVPDEPVEAIEGFWIRRPWLLSDGCPARASPPGAFTSPETLAIAEAFDEGGSRVARRGARPYTVTRKLAEGEVPPAAGFRLLLEGRLSGLEGGPFRCLSDHPDRRPVCLVL
ncbi:MAG: hypothetical protein V4656_15855, partial [Pseudomonadota bacterium]